MGSSAREPGVMPRLFLFCALFYEASGGMEQAQGDELEDMSCRSAARHLPQIISGLAGWI